MNYVTKLCLARARGGDDADRWRTVSDDGIVRGEDGVGRLRVGCSTPDYHAYHDTEWGFPVDRRPPAVREALPGGLPGGPVVADDPAQARGLPRGVRRLRLRARRALRRRATSSGCSPTPASSATAARSRRRSTTPSARVELVDEEGSLAALRVALRAGRRARPLDRAALRRAGRTAESAALAKDLKRRGWRFVGPTTVYAFMQAMGLVNDHLEGCDAARRGRGAQALRAALARTVPSYAVGRCRSTPPNSSRVCAAPGACRRGAADAQGRGRARVSTGELDRIAAGFFASHGARWVRS